MNEAEPAHVVIYVVSTRNLYSELLAFALQEQACERCEVVPDITTIIPTLPRKAEGTKSAPSTAGKTILLVDCIENDFDHLVNTLSDHEVEPSDDLIIAIYNVYSGWGIEGEALAYGIKGFFYKQDSLKLFLKGINAILGNEIWVSREILMRSALGGLRQKQSSIQEKTGLSMREVEILRLVAGGSSNEDIAQRLFISPNTVKTHMYNIFKKINVSNRLQAASWAAINL